MYKYIHGVFQKNKNLNMLNDYENIYLHLVGGIDAINTSIRFNAIQKLGTKIQSELHVNEDTSTAFPIQSIRQFLQSNDNNTVRKMIKLKFNILQIIRKKFLRIILKLNPNLNNG